MYKAKERTMYVLGYCVCMYMHMYMHMHNL